MEVVKIDGIDTLGLEDKLGEGASGAVYSAVMLRNLPQLHEGDPIAVKFYKNEILNIPHQKERVNREASISSKIQHPNVIQIFGVFETNRGKCLIMEKCLGPSLRNYLNGSEKKAPMSLCVQLLNGLSAIHKAGIIHRDIKPENIFLSKSHSRLKIGDFGVAKIEGAPTITYSKDFLGTIRYAAPESLFDARNSFQSDQYSAGVVVWEILTGKAIVPDSGTFALRVIKVRDNEPNPSNMATKSKDDIIRRKAVLKMLSKNPDDRFSDTQDAAESFDKASKSEWWHRTVSTFKIIYEGPVLREQLASKRAERLYTSIIANPMAPFGIGALNSFVSQNASDIAGFKCPICNQQYIFIDRIEDKGISGYTCIYCSYSSELAAWDWRKMLESTDIRDLSYDIVALAAALENTNGLPKESSLKTVSNLF